MRFELDGKPFVAIDTPGLKRNKSIATDVDFYSSHRAQRSIRRADVVLMFFDPTQRIGKVDKQLCEYIAENYKPCMFVVNKWDLVAGSMPTEKWVTYLHDTFRTMWYVPMAFVTGQTGKNVKALLNHAQMLYKQAGERVTTGQLNRVVRAAIDANPAPLYQNRRPKIYYATQVGTEPPTIVLFCNEPKAFGEPYRRYLLGVLREHMPFAEVPIKLYLRKRQSGDGRAEIEADEPEPAAQESPTSPPADQSRFGDRLACPSGGRRGEPARAVSPSDSRTSALRVDPARLPWRRSAAFSGGKRRGSGPLWGAGRGLSSFV